MNGVIVLDKPQGKTSHDVVMKVKKSLGVRKAGHTGTLDPLATGVLPVCINEATKLATFLLHEVKEYRVTMLLGVETDTYDIEGKIIARNEPTALPDDIELALARFTGKIIQTPPMYSAVKVNGKAMYKWTRQGIDVIPPSRKVEIYKIEIEQITLPYVQYTVSCSKGSYVRTLCHDIGKSLGCGACLSGLRRIRCGSFFEKAAVSLEKISREQIIPMIELLPDIPEVVVCSSFAQKLMEGYQPDAQFSKVHQMPYISVGDVIKLTDERRHLVAIARSMYSSDQLYEFNGKEQIMKVLRVFHQ